ncbi:MAG: hypothetical protein ACYSVY_21990 [Planctomycetota bacterium]|jgi:hypothetical protein
MGNNSRTGLFAALLLIGVAAHAENIDPGNDASQYAYAENIGWLNAEPNGDGADGVQVDDFTLTGYMWGENIGWVSLSCRNTTSCAATEYGVDNDGAGVLSGFAYAENVGWINFAPSTAGVSIDVITGDFSGRAWAENVGWVTFASTGANPYKVKTSWNCDPAPAVPSGSPTLAVDKSGADALLSWSTVTGSTGFDAVQGDLGTLISSGGDFSQATVTQQCIDDNNTTASLLFSGTPALGEAFWFLVRGVNCAEGVSGLHGTYDTGGPAQVGFRDTEIAGSGNDCF